MTSEPHDPSAGRDAEPETAPPKRSRRRRLLRRGAGALLLAAAALAGCLWFALGTEPGARWLFTRLGALLPGELEVADLDGPVRGPLTVHGLRYATESMEVTVERVFLDWRLRELLERRLDIHRLEADGVDVVTMPGPEEPERGPLPDVNLRFNIVVRDARVRDVEIRSLDELQEAAAGEPEAAEPFVIDAIDLATVARGGLVDVESLRLRSPDLDLDAAGTLRPQGAYDIDLEARWVYRGGDLPTFAGGGTLTGTLQALRVRQDLSEPFAVRLDALLGDPLYDLSFEAELAAEGVRTTAIDPEWPAVTADARLVAEGTLEALALRGTVDADSAEYGRLRTALDVALELPGDAAGEPTEIEVRELVATRPVTSTRVRLTGGVTLPAAPATEEEEGDPIRFDLAAAWRDFAWPLDGEPAVSSARGEAEVAGTVDDYRLRAEAAVSAGALDALGPLGTWRVEGRGDASHVELASLAGDLLRGRLSGSGRVSWDPRVSWRLDLAGSGIDPSVLAADYPGSLAFRASTSGHLPEAPEGADAAPVGRVELARLEGTLRGQPVSARGTVEMAGGVYRLEPFRVTWAEDRLTARGTVGKSYDLELHLVAPNLAVALPDAAGTLTADATVTGPADAPRIDLAARGEALSYGDLRAGGLNLDARVDLGAGGPIELDLAATGVDLGTVHADRLTLVGAGTREEHTVALDLFPGEGGPAAARLALAGGLAPSGAGDELAWRGRITRLDLDADRARGLGAALGEGSDDLPALGTWSLERPAALAASAEEVELDGFCWSGRGQICAEGAWRAEAGWNVDARLADVPLALAGSFLPPDVAITGDLDGVVAARSDAAGRLTGVARLVPGPGVLVYPAASEREQRLRFERGNLTATAGPEGVSADLGLVLVDVGRIEGHLELPGYGVAGAPAESQAVRARLSAELADLSFVQALVDGVTGVEGRLDADLLVSGTLASPEVRGEAVLTDGRADYPEYGLELRDLRLVARGVGREPITLDGSLTSGGGRLEIGGRVPLAPSPQTPARLTVSGRRVEVIDTEEIRALASPDLTLVYDGSLARVTGEVLVPEAEVEIERRGEGGAVAASDDVVFVGADGAEPADAGGMEIAARVRVILGEDVEVDVLGLHAEPEGSLLLVEEPGRPTSATGELDLAGGTFQAYGQDLTIERGRLVFAGPITEPAIDLRAYRRADDGTVAGLEATGTLRRPVVTLWSEPPMAQSDQLSYLLLGRPLDQAGESDGSLLANAATSLGIKGGNLLGERLAARFGLEEARIEADDGLEQASLVLGKYLSPRLFVGYGIGLFDAVNTFRIRYLLTDELTLEAETGAGTSADLLYTIERGEGAKREAPEGSVREALEERPEASPAEADDGSGR